MSLPHLCIKRPVFTIVINLMVLLVGAFALNNLPVRQFPSVDQPVVTVSAYYPGASPALVEHQVTTPLEQHLGSVSGLRYMTSTSNEGKTAITLHFDIGSDAGTIVNEVRQQVDQAMAVLPTGVERPLVSKSTPDSQAIIYLSVDSDTLSPTELTIYARRFLLSGFQSIDGVSSVDIFGGSDYVMHMTLDPIALAAFNLTPSDVVSALGQQSVNAPAGRIQSLEREYSLETRTGLSTVKEFENLILRDNNDYPIRFSDVGTVTLAGSEPSVLFRVNGKTSVALGLKRESTANPIDIADRTQQHLDRIADTVPSNIHISKVYDSTIFIRNSIAEVRQTLIEAFVLVVAVIFLFLGSWRATLVPIVAIPVSLVGVLALMYALGFSLNTLTLLALVMAIGLVVDDAIVVLENIHRHHEEGLSPVQAAYKGSSEITPAVVAMTITLAAVFAPIGWMPGSTGQYFREFAFTLAGAVVISGFVALTLSPMMSAKVLASGSVRTPLTLIVGKCTTALANGYSWLLKLVLKVRFIIVLLAIGVGWLGWWLYAVIPSEMAPMEDQGYIMSWFSTPTSSSLSYTDTQARALEAINATAPGFDHQIMIVGSDGPTQGIGFVMLKPWEQRTTSSRDAMMSLWGPTTYLPGASAFPILPPTLNTGSGGKPVQMVIRTTADYAALQETMSKLMQAASSISELTNLDSSLRFDSLQYEEGVDRLMAARFGVDEAEISEALGIMFGGRNATKFELDGRNYDVNIRLSASDRQDTGVIERIFVRGRNGVIPLSSVVSLGQAVGPAKLDHFDQLRSATLSATLTPGATMGDALTKLIAAVHPVLPNNYSYDFTGEARDFNESQGAVGLILGLALAVIFLVLAAQFESFITPAVILFTVPLALTGAMGTLYLLGLTNNVYTMIGMVTLIGLTTKNGILIVEFANQLRDEGRDIYEAVIAAASVRLRPILMTVSAMVIGLIPLALATGPGAEGRKAIGWAVIGGLSFGTLLTLFVVPAVYTYLAGKRGSD